MQLYAIKSEYDAILQLCNQHAEENNGEIPESLSDSLEAICDTLEEKAVNCALLVKNCLGEAEAIKCEEKRLAARRKIAENTAERVKTYLSAYLPAGTKINEARVVIGWRKSEAVKINDGIAVPREYCRIIPETVEPDKIALKSALKSGVEIAGVSIEEKQNIQIK